MITKLNVKKNLYPRNRKIIAGYIIQILVDKINILYRKRCKVGLKIWKAVVIKEKQLALYKVTFSIEDCILK